MQTYHNMCQIKIIFIRTVFIAIPAAQPVTTHVEKQVYKF